MDYRKLNAATTNDVFPLPRVDDLVDCLGGAKIFTTLDEASGYWQIPMSTNCQPLTAFTTHHGLFEFRVMPFGLCNALSTFQRWMQLVLSGLEDICSIYIDDILVCSKTPEEHISHAKQVFERLREAALNLKPRKCRFGRREVPYLCYIISDCGLSPDPEKTEAV